jgi:hypothetical protein
MTGFAAKLKQEVGGVKPLSDWQFVMLDPESKARFYLELSPGVKNYSVVGKRETQTEATLSAAWPMLSERQPNVIFISRKMYEPMLKNLLPNYTEIEAPATFGERLMHKKNQNAPIAFVPPSAV